MGESPQLTFNETLCIIGPCSVLVTRDEVIALHVIASITAHVHLAFVGGLLVMEHCITIFQFKGCPTV